MPVPGYLCVGAAESLLRVTDQFVLEEIGGSFIYMRSVGERERTAMSTQRYGAPTWNQVKKVLVVDDSAYVRKTLKQILSRSPFLEVVGTARDGEEALRLVRELQPDVVTVDLIMPGMDGAEFTSRVMAANPVPVVVVSIARGVERAGAGRARRRRRRLRAEADRARHRRRCSRSRTS